MKTPLALLFLSPLAACSGAPHTSSPATTPAARHPIQFIEDDYARALTEARAAKKPLFVDAWATWCHTCLSMRAYVFPDPQLDAYADKFVWLSIDTEKPENARFVETHPMKVWPTLWVIDSADERVALKWQNSATAPELGSLLEDAALAMKQGDAGKGSMDAGAALVRGNRATAEGKTSEAIEAYREAIARAPRDWPKRANAVESLVTRLDEAKEYGACAEVGATELPQISAGTSRVTAAIVALECAAKTTPPDAALRDRLQAMVRTMAFDSREAMLPDDRSGLFETLVETLHDEKRDADAREVATAWATFLDAEAAKAKTPAARATFDAHRLEAYIEIGEPQRAIPMLEQSEREMPADYNPPYRLAMAYLEMHRFADARAAIDRALARAYGPRRLRVWAIKSKILAAEGDPHGAAAALREAIAETKSMTLTGGQPKLVHDLEERARALEATAK